MMLTLKWAGIILACIVVLTETGPFTSMSMFVIALALDLVFAERAAEQKLKQKLEVLRDEAFRDGKL